jgi:hypothetical protein
MHRVHSTLGGEQPEYHGMPAMRGDRLDADPRFLGRIGGVVFHERTLYA